MIKSLRGRLRAGEVTFGSWLSLGSSLTAEIFGRAGFDWLVIDMEHGTGDFRELVHQLQALEATPAVPLVRVAFNEPWLIKRTLDLGPSGLLIPVVESAEQARQAVRAMRYPPEGIRGVITSSRSTSFGSEFAQYRASANELLLTVIQIELKQAVEEVDAIAAIPEVDVLFVGPVDLTTSLGVPGQLDSDIAQAALQRIEHAARAHGKALGILMPNYESVVPYKERGYQFVGVGSDVALLNQSARTVVQALKEGNK
ncbi:MAG: HpcH/HpaI aldolase/citrate lyase family protein [Chloroflexi bacterium]|nr:HpcH/HpaI aldolase/citrate lyase family protein [Chloroflexota bacterium]